MCGLEKQQSSWKGWSLSWHPWNSVSLCLPHTLCNKKVQAVRSNNGPRTVVLNSSYILESSDEIFFFFFKDTMPRFHCRLIKSESLRLGPGYWYFLKSLPDNLSMQAGLRITTIGPKISIILMMHLLFFCAGFCLLIRITFAGLLGLASALISGPGMYSPFLPTFTDFQNFTLQFLAQSNMFYKNNLNN